MEQNRLDLQKQETNNQLVKCNKLTYKIANLHLAIKYHRKDSEALLSINRVLEKENDKITKVVKETLDVLKFNNCFENDNKSFESSTSHFLREQFEKVGEFKQDFGRIRDKLDDKAIKNS